MEKMYMVSESELRELLYDSLAMQMLDRDGVDNWGWYGESRNDIIRDFFPDFSDEEIEETDLDFDDCIDILMKDYCEVER